MLILKQEKSSLQEVAFTSVVMLTDCIVILKMAEGA